MKGKEHRKVKQRLIGILTGGILLAGITVNGQQLSLYSQYTFNGFLINPAIAGSEGYTAVNLTAREQWLGIPNAPKTHAISFQTRFLKDNYISRNLAVRKRIRRGSRSGRVGLGVYAYNDKSGLIDRTGISVTYGYHIQLRNSQLSLGLSLNAYQFKINSDAIVVNDEQDLLIDGSRKRLFIPDANFGAYFVNKNMYAGLSVSDMLQSALRLSAPGAVEYKLNRHYYLVSGFKYNVSRSVTLEPSFLLKATNNGAFQLDIGSKVYIDENYWVGMSYRTGSALIFLCGLKVDKYYFGYAFDYTLSNIMSHTYGTHEFVAAVKFGDNARRYRWLNRF